MKSLTLFFAILALVGCAAVEKGVQNLQKMGKETYAKFEGQYQNQELPESKKAIRAEQDSANAVYRKYGQGPYPSNLVRSYNVVRHPALHAYTESILETVQRQWPGKTLPVKIVLTDDYKTSPSAIFSCQS